MKTNSEKPYMIREIKSFRDLEKEKLRLKAETVRIEKQMTFNNLNIKEALSPGNIIKSVINEVSTAAPWITAAYSIGQNIFKKRKKNKRFKDVDFREEE
jgi:hypothetical protein